ncbi:P-selectin glycoprotein ligand 1 [Oenanthe melanoleuca]|uniref:P-selectin glycoprotein ligand 1 n=1 Tax=Oenanthe melanoleuca TaxID=2939378 RepID=UPI0024C1A409|nr:P-selectin glycoprotein ligand 1 [Oenanthe melanoleuca]
MVQRGGARHEGCAKNIKSGPPPPPPPPPPRVLRRFPVWRYLRHPGPLPGHAHTVPGGGGIPGTRFAVTSAFGATRTPARSCSAGPPLGPSRGLPQGRKPLFGVQPSPRGARRPPALGGPTLGVTPFPRGLCKPQPLFRARSPPRPAGAAGGRCPRRPTGGCRCWGCPRAPAAETCSRDPPAFIGTGPMALGWAVLVLLVLSPLRACGAELLEPGLPRGGQWVWGVAKPRGKRDDSGQEPGATAMIGSDKSEGVSVPPPAPVTKASLLRVPTTADPMDDSPEPELLLSSAAPEPSTNTSLLRVLAASTTAEPLDETDSPEPDLLEDSAAPAAPSASTRLLWVPVVSTTADPMDETDPPDPDLLLSSAPPPAPSTKASRALVVPSTADPMDETDSPDPDLLPGSEPGTSSAPQRSIATTTRSWLTSPLEEDTVTDGLDSGSSTGPRSAAPPAFVLTTTGYKKPKKSGAPPAATPPAPWDTAAVPWEPSGVMSRCLLAIVLLGLVAATFVVCTGVLGSLLWRRARTGQRRFSRTEMVCISSLLPDAEAAAGPRPVPARRHKLLLPDGSSEPDGDNLTLSSFLPEHS